MSLSMSIPSGGKSELTPEQRAQRSAAANEVAASAPYRTAGADVQPAAVAAPVAAKAAAGARPWESLIIDKGVKRRLPLNIPVALRAKLEYLESQEPEETKSTIAEAGIVAECLRIEQANGLLAESEARSVRAAVADPRQGSQAGNSRIVLMIQPEVHGRVETLKELRLVSSITEVALAGIEDECNRRLKKRGEL